VCRLGNVAADTGSVSDSCALKIHVLGCCSVAGPDGAAPSRCLQSWVRCNFAANIVLFSDRYALCSAYDGQE
jgi:hypothetical protein